MSDAKYRNRTTADAKAGFSIWTVSVHGQPLTASQVHRPNKQAGPTTVTMQSKGQQGFASYYLKTHKPVVEAATTKINIMKKFFSLLAVALFSISAFAQDAEKKDAPVGKNNPDVAALRLAGDLVKYGYAQQSAVSLVSAIEILQNTPTKQLDAQRQGPSDDNVSSKGESDIMTFDIPQLIADAKDFAEAAGDNSLLEVISALEQKKEGHRGAVGGSKIARSRVLANSTDVYNIRFVGDRFAEVVVVGDGDTDLDLYVYDENGNLIVSDADYTDNCYVSWNPIWTGNFKIKIVNRGGVYNRYVLMTN